MSDRQEPHHQAVRKAFCPSCGRATAMGAYYSGLGYLLRTHKDPANGRICRRGYANMTDRVPIAKEQP